MNFKTGDIVKVAGFGEPLFTFLSYDERFADNNVSILSNSEGKKGPFFTHTLRLANPLEEEVDEL